MVCERQHAMTLFDRQPCAANIANVTPHHVTTESATQEGKESCNRLVMELLY